MTMSRLTRWRGGLTVEAEEAVGPPQRSMAWLSKRGDSIRSRLAVRCMRPEPVVTTNVFDNDDTFHTVARVIMNRIVCDCMEPEDAIMETLPTQQKRQSFLESLDFRRADILNQVKAAQLDCPMDRAVLHIETVVGSALREMWRESRFETGTAREGARNRQPGSERDDSHCHDGGDAVVTAGAVVYREPCVPSPPLDGMNEQQLHQLSGQDHRQTETHEERDVRSGGFNDDVGMGAIHVGAHSYAAQAPPVSMGETNCAPRSARRQARRRRFFPDMDTSQHQRAKTRIRMDWKLPGSDIQLPIQSLRLDNDGSPRGRHSWGGFGVAWGTKNNDKGSDGDDVGLRGDKANAGYVPPTVL